MMIRRRTVVTYMLWTLFFILMVYRFLPTSWDQIPSLYPKNIDPEPKRPQSKVDICQLNAYIIHWRISQIQVRLYTELVLHAIDSRNIQYFVNNVNNDDFFDAWDITKSELFGYLESYTDLRVVEVEGKWGMYAMASAIFNRQALLVHSDLEVLKSLYYTVRFNQLDHLVMMMWNDVQESCKSLSHSFDSFEVPSDPGVKPPLIRLDTLIPLVGASRILLVFGEGDDFIKTLQGGIDFLQQINVQAIITQVGNLTDSNQDPKISWLVNFFKRHQFRPYKFLTSPIKLDFAYVHKWPKKIVWRRE